MISPKPLITYAAPVNMSMKIRTVLIRLTVSAPVWEMYPHIKPRKTAHTAALASKYLSETKTEYFAIKSAAAEMKNML